MRRAAPAALLAALLAGVAAAPAAADREAELARLRSSIRDSRERVAVYEREGRGLLEALEALDRTAAALERDVRRERRLAEAARASAIEMGARVEALAGPLEQTRQAMSARAVGLYKAGELGSVRLLFSSSGPREFLSRIYALRRLLAHDGQLLARYRSQHEAFELARAQARRAAIEHDEAVERLAERSQQLDAERATKQQLVARATADRARERAALIELETAARALEETLEALEGAGRAASRPAGPPFAELRGRLARPVAAPVARDFGRVVDAEFLTETFRKGVEFDAPLGAPVRAVAAGQVRFAGWFSGYGRLVIVDHGEQYFTVFGHLAELDVSVGEGVDAGGVIGTVGETGSLTGPRLYFEIRLGARPLDPAEWLGSHHPG